MWKILFLLLCIAGEFGSTPWSGFSPDFTEVPVFHHLTSFALASLVFQASLEVPLHVPGYWIILELCLKFLILVYLHSVPYNLIKFHELKQYLHFDSSQMPISIMNRFSELPTYIFIYPFDKFRRMSNKHLNLNISKSELLLFLSNLLPLQSSSFQYSNSIFSIVQIK